MLTTAGPTASTTDITAREYASSNSRSAAWDLPFSGFCSDPARVTVCIYQFKKIHDLGVHLPTSLKLPLRPGPLLEPFESQI